MSGSPPSSSLGLLASLRRTLTDTLTRLLPPTSPVALIGFPNHPNPGDSAIWLGEIAVLRQLGHRVVYACDERSYSRAELQKRLDGGTILLSGGGSLGDLWPFYHQLRERVIAEFPDNRIIQLPQSIYFKSHSALQRTRDIFDAHPDLTLMLRDEASLALAQESFAAKALLCPDMAFGLGPLRRPRQPERRTLYLLRDDIESTPAGAAIRGERQTFDWLEQPTAHAVLRRLGEYVGTAISRTPAPVGVLARPLGRLYNQMASLRVAAGCRLLARGEIVVTDRLHGHILCLLMSIPHVCLDNSYGKVRAFTQTWTQGSTLMHWADSLADADRLAEGLAQKPSNAD